MRNIILSLVLLATVAAGHPIASIGRAWTAAQRQTGGGDPWTPENLGTNVVIWFDAADYSTIWADTNATTAATNNGFVSRWDSKSGNHFAFTQADSFRPKMSSDGLVFAPTNRLIVTTFTNAQPLTACMVFDNSKPELHIALDSLNSNRSFLGGRGVAATPFLCDATTAGGSKEYGSWRTNAAIHTVAFNGASSYGVIDGVSTNFALGANGFQGMSIGQIRGNPDAVDGRYHIIGSVRDVIVAKVALTESDRQKLEGYLAHKWGLTGNLPADHPYKNSPPHKE